MNGKIVPPPRNQWFPKGDGPCVAVLIPTRGRSDRLLRAVRSLHDTAHRSISYEIILRVDADDTETLDALANKPLSSLVNKVVIGPRGNGYLDIHHHYHAMIEESSADWFLSFNDDAVMKTVGWNLFFCGVLARRSADDPEKINVFGGPDGIYIMRPYVSARPDSPEFFAFHRRVYEVLGHVGLNTGIDDWLHGVMSVIQRVLPSDIVIEHENEQDVTYCEGRGFLSSKDVYELTASFPVLRERLRDTVKLLDYIEAFNKGELGQNP
jgi:glycosyltransferase involved in cell wall biosynthesis